MSAKEVTESEVLADIRRVARLLLHSPSSVEYKRHGHHDVRTAQRKLQLPWGRIVEAAGLRYAPRTSHLIPATEELRRDVLQVTRELGHPPTRSEYGARGRFDSETVRRRSGKRRWEEALSWLTGVDPEEVKRHQRRGGCYRTTDEWLSRLNDLSRRLGRAPTTAEANGAGINAHELRRRVRGGWGDVLAAAGVSACKQGVAAGPLLRVLLPEPLPIFVGAEECLHHLSPDEVAVKLVELAQPEVVAGKV
jgi:hypothetical protein